MSWINEFGIHTWGFLLSMAGVCCLTHLIYQRSLLGKQRRIDELDERNVSLTSEAEDAIHDERIARLENSLLREFLSQQDAKSALRQLMRRYVVNADTDFAVYIEIAPDTSRIIAWSGLDISSREGLEISPELQYRIAAQRVLVLEGSDLFNSPLMEGLSRTDRRKAASVVCIACDASNGHAGVFITTAFPLERVARESQIELTCRLLNCINRHYKQSDVVAAQEDELLIASDIMELRSIADRDFTTPLSMARAILEHLIAQLGAFRGTYFVISADAASTINRFADAGVVPQQNLIQKWEATEERLAKRGAKTRNYELLERDTLQDELHISSLVTTALTIPLYRENKPRGVVCLTWQTSKVLSKAEMKLAEWCCQSLADGLIRVTEWAKATRESKEDGLTQLVNRRKFDEQLEIEIAAASQSSDPCGLLLLDLDRFKLVNDTFGHQAGDEVLRVAAERLRNEVTKVRGGDRILAARYGGEEMAVILPKFDTPGAKRVAECIRQSIEAEAVTHGADLIDITASIGVAIYPHHGETPTDLVEFADQGLYEAKDSGRNRVCIASTAATNPR